MKNETELIKSTAKRQLTAKGYKFLNKCICIMAEHNGLTRYHAEVKPQKEKLHELITHLIIDKKQSINDIKEMIKNRNIPNAVNYPPTPEAMGWASGVSTLTNVNSSS